MTKKPIARRYALYASIALMFAIATKLYRGPYWMGINAWAGDVGIVVCLYFILGAFFTKQRPVVKLVVITAVAVFVECFQLTGIPASLNLPAPFVWLLGSKFDYMDFVFYAIGLGIAFFLDSQYLVRYRAD